MHNPRLPSGLTRGRGQAQRAAIISDAGRKALKGQGENVFERPDERIKRSILIRGWDQGPDPSCLSIDIERDLCYSNFLAEQWVRWPPKGQPASKGRDAKPSTYSPIKGQWLGGRRKAFKWNPAIHANGAGFFHRSLLTNPR
jgi:hypothetical protein